MFSTKNLIFYAFAASSILPISLTHAHILMSAPTSLGYKGNPYATNTDFDLSFPIKGPQFPCKQFHKDTARGAGRSVGTWAAGSTQSFTLEGAAIHGGGSCQASLSYDNGATFRVIKSWIGACPVENGGTFSFPIPTAAASGAALFAWTWFNKIGNREMYMNCAAVTITGGGSGLGTAYPRTFVAQIGTNGCTVPEGIAVEFPNPGAVVQRGDGNKSAAPNGTDCF